MSGSPAEIVSPMEADAEPHGPIVKLCHWHWLAPAKGAPEGMGYKTFVPCVHALGHLGAHRPEPGREVAAWARTYYRQFHGLDPLGTDLGMMLGDDWLEPSRTGAHNGHYYKYRGVQNGHHVYQLQSECSAVLSRGRQDCNCGED